jgi:membrane fusion protein (multidrug efflux system)
LVPQKAVADLQGNHQVAVVASDGRIRIQPVELGETVGTEWIVRDGLKLGETLVVEGLQKVRQGMHVDPKPYQAR